MNTNETKIIKTPANYWIKEIGSLLLFLIILPVAILYLGGIFYLLGGLVVLIGIINLFRDLPPAYNAKIIIDSSEIKGNVEGYTFAQRWNDIKAVSFSGDVVPSLLTIGTENHVFNISSKFFDKKELEKEFRTHLLPEVFDSFAFQRLSVVQKFEQDRKRQFDNLQEPLQVSIGKSEKNIGVISFLLCVFMLSLLFFPVDKIAPLVLAAFFGGLSLVLIVFSIGTIESNREIIILKMIFRKYELSWNNLHEVYINLHNHTIVLIGDRCRILLPSTTSWSGRDCEQLYELIILKIENSGIQSNQGRKPLYWRSKNF